MDNQMVEITDEMLEDAKACPHHGCSGCRMGDTDTLSCIVRIAAALKAEREERKLNPGVWDGAPDSAIMAQVKWHTSVGYYGVSSAYTRTLPKSKAREIAELSASKWAWSVNQEDRPPLSDLIEAAILEFAESTK